MRSRIPGALLLMLGAASAHAALEGRDLNGTPATAEAWYDTVLDVTWLADANFIQTSGADADGLADLGASQAWAQSLVIGGHADWRLPKVEPINGVGWNVNLAQPAYDGSREYGYNITDTGHELAYMFHVNLGNQGAYDLGGAPTSCHPNLCFVDTGPFVNVVPQGFMTQTIYNGLAPFIFSSSSGLSTLGNVQARAWVLHDGDIGVPIAAVPEPGTWALWLAGLGLLARSARRRG